MYVHLIKYLKEKYNYTNISLCKETIEMWEKLRSKFESPDMDYKKIRCNCVC